jgi:hypothetical protein
MHACMHACMHSRIASVLESIPWILIVSDNMSPSSNAYKALARANLSMLRQKAGFIHLLKTKFGDNARHRYQQVCPIVHASVGQHIRHSMDHIELILRMNDYVHNDELHYDLRTRGGNDESDIDAALTRISTVTELLLLPQQGDFNTDNRPMKAFFMLSGDPTEFQLSTTLERELGFGVHHAIHHMAMVKIIAVQTLEIPTEELTSDFGRAPSTVVHEEKIF